MSRARSKEEIAKAIEFKKRKGEYTDLEWRTFKEIRRIRNNVIFFFWFFIGWWLIGIPVLMLIVSLNGLF